MNSPSCEQWAEPLGAPLAEHQLDVFRLYRDELLSWTVRRANLTAITDPDEVESRLFLESLWCAGALPATEGLRLIDVGSGGGFPGLPLAIAFPRLDVTLVEATGKKIQFLEHVVGVLGLRNCHVFQGRAEDLGTRPGSPGGLRRRNGPRASLLCPPSSSCVCHLSDPAACSSPPKARTPSRK